MLFWVIFIAWGVNGLFSGPCDSLLLYTSGHADEAVVLEREGHAKGACIDEKAISWAIRYSGMKGTHGLLSLENGERNMMQEDPRIADSVGVELLQASRAVLDRGGSLLIPRIDAALPCVSEKLEHLSRWLPGLLANANLYIGSPGGTRALRIHHDVTDVLVWHEMGVKEWEIYQSLVRMPFDADEEELTSVPNGIDRVLSQGAEKKFNVSAGDVLWLSRGIPHRALPGVNEDGSLVAHITVALSSFPRVSAAQVLLLGEQDRLEEFSMFLGDMVGSREEEEYSLWEVLARQSFPVSFIAPISAVPWLSTLNNSAMCSKTPSETVLLSRPQNISRASQPSLCGLWRSEARYLQTLIRNATSGDVSQRLPSICHLSHRLWSHILQPSSQLIQAIPVTGTLRYTDPLVDVSKPLSSKCALKHKNASNTPLFRNPHTPALLLVSDQGGTDADVAWNVFPCSGLCGNSNFASLAAPPTPDQLTLRLHNADDLILNPAIARLARHVLSLPPWESITLRQVFLEKSFQLNARQHARTVLDFFQHLCSHNVLRQIPTS